MRRRTLDIVFSIGGALLAVAAAVLALVLFNQASFANDYVHDQLAQQKITFTAADKLTADESKASCLVANGGKQLKSGKQAECYANEYIGLHVSKTADGKTYAELGAVQSDLRAKIAALPTTDPSVADLNKQLTTVTNQRETLFKGETLRGLLLTSYGFSIFGERAELAGWVAAVAAVVLALASLAGFVHALRTPADVAIAPVDADA